MASRKRLAHCNPGDGTGSQVLVHCPINNWTGRGVANPGCSRLSGGSSRCAAVHPFRGHYTREMVPSPGSEAEDGFRPVRAPGLSD